MVEPLITSDLVHRHIRHAWRRYALPAVVNRDTTLLLGALVVADTSLDEMLLAEGYIGDTTGNRVRSASHSFSDYTAVLAARSVRHQAVHHLDYHLCWPAGAQALMAYARALWEHGVDIGDAWHMADDE